MPLLNPPTIVGSPLVDPRITLWSGRRQRSQELKQLHESTWIRNWRMYRNYVEPLSDPADWWRSNEGIPTVYKIVETILPRLVTGMFDSPDWFNVEARNGRSELYETMCFNLLRQVLEEMDLFPKIYQAMRYASIMGHAWGKLTWREEWEMRQVMVPRQATMRETIEEEMGQQGLDEAVNMYGEEMLEEPSGQEVVEMQLIEEQVYDLPDFEWRPLDRIFPDPTGRNRWFLEEIDTTIEELYDAQASIPNLYNRDALAALAYETQYGKRPNEGTLDAMGYARSGTASGVSMEYAREPQATENIPEDIVSPNREGGGIKLWQCWGWVPEQYRASDGVAWRLVVIADGRYILRDVICPTPDMRPPYFPIKSIDIPTRLYGASIIEYVGGLNEQQNRLSNMRLDEVFLGVWQQYVFKKNSVVSDNSLLMQPGGAIEVDPGPQGGIQDTFAVLPRRGLLPDVWQEDQWRQSQAEHVAAATDIMQGVGGSGDTTATEVERLLQQGNARHVLQIMYNDYTIKRELLKRTWKLLQQRLTKPRLVRLQGEEAVEVGILDLQVPIDINVGGGLHALSKQNRISADQELIAMATNPITAEYFKMHPVLRKWMQDRGWRNPENYLKTEEELANERYQMGLNEGMAAMGAAEHSASLAAQSGEQGAVPSGPGSTSAAPPPSMQDMPLAGQEASMGGQSLA